MARRRDRADRGYHLAFGVGVGLAVVALGVAVTVLQAGPAARSEEGHEADLAQAEPAWSEAA